jgi:hypothetical protein
MAIETTVYDSETLLGVFYDDDFMDPPESYWLDTFFTQEVNFTDEFIDFSKISDVRKLAPLVVPTAQGKPIYSAAERRTVVKPAYVKPKDAVTASRMLRKRAGLGEMGRGRRELTPQQRYDAIVADIIRQHRFAIERRWEWMAAQAILYGAVTLEDEAYPRTLVDFGRAAGHTITLSGAARWGESGVSILGNVGTWKGTMRDAPFGGVANRLTVGSAAWEVMRADDEIKEQLNVQYRLNSGVNLKMGLLDGTEVEYVGTIGAGVEVYVYSDYYQNPDGSVVPYMDPRDVVLSGPSVQGVRAFGAIADVGAQFQAVPVFPKMYEEQDPSVTFIMHQSAPLMVPVNPNATLRARVIA